MNDKCLQFLKIDKIQVDEKTRTVEFTGTDETMDRADEIVSFDGWELGNYKKNPIVLLGHNFFDLPIGKSLRIIKDKAKRALRFQVQFADAETYPKADTVFRLISKGFLNAVSVSFKPLETIFPAMEDAAAMSGHGKRKKKPRRKFLRQELLELSVVTVPMNPNALAARGLEELDTVSRNILEDSTSIHAIGDVVDYDEKSEDQDTECRALVSVEGRTASASSEASGDHKHKINVLVEDEDESIQDIIVEEGGKDSHIHKGGTAKAKNDRIQGKTGAAFTPDGDRIDSHTHAIDIPLRAKAEEPDETKSDDNPIVISINDQGKLFLDERTENLLSNLKDTLQKVLDIWTYNSGNGRGEGSEPARQEPGADLYEKILEDLKDTRAGLKE